jgi:hypothetical protein
MKLLPVLVLCLLIGVTPLQAADMPKGALCALAEIQECDSGSTCQRVSAEEIAAPRFIRVELAKKTMQGVGPRAQERVTKIQFVQQHGDVIFAEGVDEEVENKRPALGWILAMTPADGSMQLTATGGDSTFVATGSCLFDK